MSVDSAAIRRERTNDADLDWAPFEDRARAAFVEELDRAALSRSSTLQRVVDLAATLAGSEFAQVSLISDIQYVPVSHGLDPGGLSQAAPARDSLCSVTVAAGRSVIIDDTTSHPWVRDLPPVVSGAVGSYLGVPLRRTDGLLLGALCVFNNGTSAWPDHLANALEDLVTFAIKEIELAATIQAHSLSVQQLTSVIHSIIAPAPTALPEDMQVTGRYRSADVGGDWYDWMHVGEEIAVTIGDVAGHGLPAVATMARLRLLGRAYSLEGHDPGETLRRVNDALRIEKSGEIATVFDARYRPSDRTFTYASAGHPPPLILRAREAFFADLRPSPPIGCLMRDIRVHRLTLQRDDTVLLCTDGLYEQRTSAIDVSLEELRRSGLAALQATADLEEFADALIATSFSDTNDDACLVAFRV